MALTDTTSMSWDLSIYPELTAAQQQTLRTAGLTLMRVQGVEQVLTFCLGSSFQMTQPKTYTPYTVLEEKRENKCLASSLANCANGPASIPTLN